MHLSFKVALLCAALPSIAYANADGNAAALAPSSPWKIDYAPNECRLTRNFGQGEPAVLFRLARGTSFDRYDTMIAGLQVPRKTRKVSVTVTVEPQHARETFEGQNFPVPKRAENVLRWFDGPTKMMDLNVADQIMLVETADKFTVRLHLTGFGQALIAMKACHDDLLRSWKIDPESLAQLGRLPVPLDSPGLWATVDDYPSSAVDKGLQGDVGFKLAVSAQGTARECTIIQSSNVPELDAKTCEVMLKRARFEPAASKDGVATEAPWLNRVRWILPD